MTIGVVHGDDLQNCMAIALVAAILSGLGGIGGPVRQHEMSFANFILRFGIEHALLDYVEEIVLPAFLQTGAVRTHGETSFRFFNVSLVQLERQDGTPVMALSGHFIKDTILRRQQIFDPSEGLVEDYDEIASAPSAY